MQYHYIAKGDIMSKCAPNELTRNIIYLILSFSLLDVAMESKCPKWWAIPDPLLQSKVIKANQTKDASILVVSAFVSS